MAALLCGCATSEGASGQGGAKFNAPTAAPRASAEELFPVCWPASATAQQKIKLDKTPSGAWVFEAQQGASNSTGRCLVEIIGSYPDRKDPIEVAAPSAPASGWAVLAWVQLLSSSRFGAERGILDPAPLVNACLSKGDGLRPGARFQISFDPDVRVTLNSSEGIPVPPLTASERCVDAVLGSTVWPSTRPFTLGFDKPSTGQGEVAIYFAGLGGAQGALDPVKVKEALSLRGPAVSACWNEALVRRPALSGGRSVRLRVDDTGAVTQVSVVGNVSAEPTTLSDYLLDSCLCAAARGAHFPAGGSGDAVYSWIFAQRG